MHFILHYVCPSWTEKSLGVLITCEPAIKSIIVHLDSEHHDIIIEDLDETHLFVKENMVQVLKQRLEEVGFTTPR